MVEFILAIWSVLLELAPWLLLGALIGGILHVVVPDSFLRNQLTGRGSVLKAVALGVPLPLCSCGVIPVGLQLKKSGASTGSVVAFLTSTPQTGADSILVSASMLGWPFAIFKVISAAVTGLLGGWIADLKNVDESIALPQAEEISPSSPPANSHHTAGKLREIVTHSLELIQSIWGWLVVGVLVSAAITTLVPETALTGLGTGGTLAAMGVALGISLPLYVCATASVPIAAALVAGGLPTGAAMVFLMAGPATNAATLGAVSRTLGRRPLVIYLVTIILGSIASGWAFESLIEAQSPTEHELHTMNHWWSIGPAILLLLLIGFFAWQDLARYWRSRQTKSAREGESVEVCVRGMTCGNCVAGLEDKLMADEAIDAVEITLEPGYAKVYGRTSAAHVKKLVEQAGYRAE